MELVVSKFDSVCDLAYKNLIFLNKKNKVSTNHVLAGEMRDFVFRVVYKSFVVPGTVVMNNCNRIQLGKIYGQKISIKEFRGDLVKEIHELRVSINFLDQQNYKVDKFTSADLRESFMDLDNLYFSNNQDLITDLHGTKFKVRVLGMTKEITDHGVICSSSEPCYTPVTCGKFNYKRTKIGFISGGHLALEIVDKGKEEKSRDLDIMKINLNDYGLGGLNEQFQEMLRRVYYSRLVDPLLFQAMGLRHVKGVILHGPPGTGKTLMARIMSKVLNTVTPKVVNGPEILSKYVGDSEKNLRELFADAEAEWKLAGIFSNLHIIVFDEFDAIGRERSALNLGTTNVAANVVNQLLSKMDGFDKLDNIVIVGITNRLQVLDPALLRDGRFAVKIAVTLPDESGREEIFRIHTSGMKKSGILSDSVDIWDLVQKTRNFTGAEIEGLVQNAVGFAIKRNHQAVDVTAEDFTRALEQSTPSHGNRRDDFSLSKKFIYYNAEHERLIKQTLTMIDMFKTTNYTTSMSILLNGPQGSGKTSSTAKLVEESGFSFARMISTSELTRLVSSSQKVQNINKDFFDSQLVGDAILVLDDLVQLVEFIPGNKEGVPASYSKEIVHCIATILTHKPRKGKLLVLATASSLSVVKVLGLDKLFDYIFDVPLIDRGEIFEVLEKLGLKDISLDELELALERQGLEDFFGIRDVAQLAIYLSYKAIERK